MPYLLDVRGLLCVEVLLRLRPVVEALAPGVVVHVVTDDPAAPIDLPAWCHLTGHRYLGALEGNLGRMYRIEVGVAARPVDHTRPWVARR